MNKNYRIQGTRFASRGTGLICLDLTLDYKYLSRLARRLLYARHRRHPTLLQFEDPLKDAFAQGLGLIVPAAKVVFNIDERMRMFYTSRDAGCDVETIRFHFEELMAPWLLDMPSFTICKSESFYEQFSLERGYYYPRTKVAMREESLKLCSSAYEPAAVSAFPPHKTTQ